jgi:hypothetical protein
MERVSPLAVAVCKPLLPARMTTAASPTRRAARKAVVYPAVRALPDGTSASVYEITQEGIRSPSAAGDG